MKKGEAIIWALSIFSAIATVHYFYTVLTPNYQDFSKQISDDLDLARTDCINLSDTEKIHLVQTLQSAQKALNVENNHGKASALLNSVGNDLLRCNPKLQIPYAGTELVVLGMIAIITILGIRTVLRHFTT